MIGLDSYILNSFGYLDPIWINISHFMTSLLKLEITENVFSGLIVSSFRVTDYLKHICLSHPLSSDCFHFSLRNSFLYFHLYVIICRSVISVDNIIKQAGNSRHFYLIKIERTSFYRVRRKKSRHHFDFDISIMTYRSDQFYYVQSTAYKYLDLTLIGSIISLVRMSFWRLRFLKVMLQLSSVFQYYHKTCGCLELLVRCDALPVELHDSSSV